MDKHCGFASWCIVQSAICWLKLLILHAQVQYQVWLMQQAAGAAAPGDAHAQWPNGAAQQPAPRFGAPLSTQRNSMRNYKARVRSM